MSTSTTEEDGNFDGLSVGLEELVANVPAKPVLLVGFVVVGAALSGEDDGLPLGAAEPNPKEEEVVDDFKDPKPVETAPNPPPNAVLLFDGEEFVVAPPLSSLEASFSVAEDDDFNAPNPLETTLPKPDPNPPPDDLLAAALPNPESLAAPTEVDPNVGIFALDPNTEEVALLLVEDDDTTDFSVSTAMLAAGASLTEANVPPPPPVFLAVPPFFPDPPHLPLALTIFRFFMTSSGAR